MSADSYKSFHKMIDSWFLIHPKLPASIAAKCWRKESEIHLRPEKSENQIDAFMNEFMKCYTPVYEVYADNINQIVQGLIEEAKLIKWKIHFTAVVISQERGILKVFKQLTD